MRNSALIICLLIAFASLAAGKENSTDLYKKGSRLALNGKIDESIDVFRKTIDASHRYALAHYGLGKAYLYKFGMTDDAIRHLQTSVRLDRKFARGYFYLGMAYLMKKKIPLCHRCV